MKLLITIGALYSIFSTANTIKANWTTDNIEPILKGEIAYIQTYLDSSQSEFATLSGTKMKRLEALQDYHHGQLEQMRATHDELRARLYEHSDSLIAKYIAEGHSVAYVAGARAEAEAIEKQLSEMELSIEKAFMNVMLKEEDRFIATQ